MTENTNQSSDTKSPTSGNDVIDIIRLLLSKKKFIIIVTAVITVGAIIVSLILPETFKSTSVILPETDKTKLAGLGGLADLASMAGVGPGETSPVKLYPTILKSETVLKSVIYKKYHTKKSIDSVNLIEFWDIQAKTPELAYETALKALREGLDVSMEAKTSIIYITFESRDAQLSADVINGVTSGLDGFMRTKRTTNATKQRQWIEARLGDVKQDLAISENRVKDFREKNRIVSNSPLLVLEQDRLLRDVQINATLFAELKKQFELIKIEEIKNTPIVNVMDPAVPAAMKDKPRRSSIVITSFFFALLGASCWTYVRYTYANKIAGLLVQIKK